MRKGWLLVAMMALAGCSTTPVTVKEAKPVPNDRIFAYQEANPSRGDITVVRDSGFIGGGCNLDLLVNGQRAASLATGEKVTLSLNPGRWIIGASPAGGGLCGSGLSTRERRDVQVVVEKDDKLTYRVATGSGGAITISPVGT